MSEYCKYYTYLSNSSITLKNTPWTLVGDSRAARRTMFWIPELDIFFDAGIHTDLKPQVIFISHAHYDHTRELPCYLLEPSPRGLGQTGLQPSEPNSSLTIFVPQPSQKLITNFIESAISMNKHSLLTKIDCKIIGTSISKDEIIKIKNIKFKIELFKCTHSIATHGYGLIEYRKCLNPIFNTPEYQDASGNPDPKKLAQLKKEGNELNILIEIPQVCYLLDTDHRILQIYKDSISKYKNVIIECTFIDDEHKQEARDTRHMLWSNLKPFILEFPDIQFILCHFSMRYKESEIIEFFTKENIKNVVPVVYDFNIK